MSQEYIPWTEKYRPSSFDDIVLDPINKQLFFNMLKKKNFPNILLYGPPGTGKTTTIINLINEYQKIKKNKSLVIHLNASDERGIDIIRNQIYQFVKTKNLFEVGFKFVVLDEVDYMTKNAQQALKYLLQTCGNNVKFFLICNYISKIELSLQHEFVCIRFNQLPKSKICKFIRDICEKENLDISDQNIDTIQNLHKSDIRSMINFIQLNQNVIVQQSNIIDNNIWKRLFDMFQASGGCDGQKASGGCDGQKASGGCDGQKASGGCDGQKASDNHAHATKIKQFIHMLSIHYNIDKKQIIKDYYNYLIMNRPEMVVPEIIERMEIVIHNYDCKVDVLINYFIMDTMTFNNKNNI
jgi:GTPase SAR1 family protein